MKEDRIGEDCRLRIGGGDGVGVTGGFYNFEK